LPSGSGWVRPCASRCCRRSNGGTGKGCRAALHVARERRGTQFDPELVDCFCAQAAEILEGLGGISAWDEVIALDPRLGAGLSEDNLERALAAFADFSDLKSPLHLGQSRGVAELAAQAGPKLGLPAADLLMLRRAALVKDIGMIGIPRSPPNCMSAARRSPPTSSTSTPS